MMSSLSGESLKKLLYFFELLPFVNLAVKTHNVDITKNIMANRSFNFSQLIQDEE